MSRLCIARTLAGLLLCTVLMPAAARPQQYQVDLKRPRRVVFHSKAPIDDFEGVTNRIDGYVTWGGKQLRVAADYGRSDVYFEVDLNGLDTGLGLRNRHMRENYLETSRYPYATYKGVIAGVTAGRADTLMVAVSGALTIHGVTRPAAIICPVTREAADGYRVRCQFPVRLGEFGIKIPSLMTMKLSEQVDLVVDFAVAPAPDT